LNVNKADHTSSWDEWGQVDPLWAIVTEGGKDYGRWEIDDFFASGKATIESLWETASSLGLPRSCERGLDFGCGVGRLTRAIGEHLPHVIGLDISPSMIELAHEHNAGYNNLRFAIHQDTGLAAYEDGYFDVVSSLLVLQHLPSQDAIVTYIKEFVRVLASGGVLMLQLPEYVPPAVAPASLRSRVRLRTRIIDALHGWGVSPKFLYDHVGWKPAMTMRGLDKQQVRSLVDGIGGQIAWCSEPEVDTSGVSNIFYLITH
jgi:SAM-dependent methyltransferase